MSHGVRDRTAVVLLLVGCTALIAGCWSPPVSNDIWADNQSGTNLVITLVFSAGDVNYSYSVPARTRGMLLQGFAGVPSSITVTNQANATIGTFPTTGGRIGVVVDPAGYIRVREGGHIPFPDATQFQLLQP
ncbi:MAG: hypothetical protein AB1627_17050 [Chloroflexota bacterium]